MQPRFVEGRIVAPDRRHEALEAGLVEGIVVVRLPYHVWPEARLASQIQRYVNAEPAGLGNWIDQARKRRGAGQRVVVPLGEIAPPLAAELRGHVGCVQTGRVHHQIGDEVVIAAAHAQAAVGAFETRDFGVQRHQAAGSFQIALQTQHEGVAVDDAGGFGIDAEQRVYLGFHRFDLLARQPRQLADAVDARLALVVAQYLGLGFGGCHDQLANALVGHVEGFAVFVKERLAAHAQMRLERAGGIVDAGVDYLGVAAGCFRADDAVALQHQHLAAGLSKRPGNRQAHHACADDNDVAMFGHRYFSFGKRRATPSSLIIPCE